MTIKTGNVSALYADIVGSLVPYIEDQVLLPNASFIRNFYDITGDSSGNTIKIPVVNAYTDAQAITEGTSIASIGAAKNDFEPTSVNLTMSKFGSWTDITQEAVEDASESLVRSQILARLSGGIATALDTNGFDEAASTAGTDYGQAGIAGTVLETNLVMGPDSLAYGIRRAPAVTHFYNNDTDSHNFRGTVRAGFKGIAADRIAKVSSNSSIASTTHVTSLDEFQQAVSNLRASNVDAMDGGMYAAFIGPATEYTLVKELNNVGASVPALSDLGNQALLSALLGSAVGAMFMRTNNLKSVIVS